MMETMDDEIAYSRGVASQQARARGGLLSRQVATQILSCVEQPMEARLAIELPYVE